MRLTPLIVFLALAAMLAFILLGQTKRQSSGDQPQTMNTPLPAITLQPVESKTPWDQNALKGNVTLINFYASWCSPCAAEMPELAALHQQSPTLHIMGVAWNDEPQTLKAFLKKHGNPFTQQWIDAKGDATMELGIKGIPETFIIDKAGHIRYRLSGPMTSGLRTGEIATLITQLQAETHAP